MLQENKIMFPNAHRVNSLSEVKKKKCSFKGRIKIKSLTNEEFCLFETTLGHWVVSACFSSAASARLKFSLGFLTLTLIETFSTLIANAEPGLGLPWEPALLGLRGFMFTVLTWYGLSSILNAVAYNNVEQMRRTVLGKGRSVQWPLKALRYRIFMSITSHLIVLFLIALNLIV